MTFLQFINNNRQEGQGYISEKLFKTKKNEMIRKTVTNLVAVRLKNLPTI